MKQADPGPYAGRTVAEILRACSDAMDERDAAERRAADPLAAVIADRRRTLWGRMLYGRGR